MPTGYTANVASGDVTEFTEFAMQCARAMGKLIDMRDEPADAPIPERFEPGDWYKQRIAADRRRLTEVVEASDPQLVTMRTEEYREALKRYEETIERKKQQKARYEAMLEKVEAWEPPSLHHEHFKQFMRSQLEESIRFDCSTDHLTEPELLPAREWRRLTIKKLEQSIEYFSDQDAKEIRSTSERNLWLAQLRDSLEKETADGNQENNT